MADKLTNNTDEASLQALFSSPSVFEVPFFQRRYKWTSKSLHKLRDDLVTLCDNDGDIHFLGAVIMHGQSGKPTEAKNYQVIDGQQRLTTVYLILAAVIRVLIEVGEYDTAKDLFTTYLVTLQGTQGGSNLKLHPSGQDRAALNAVVSDILLAKDFGKKIEGFTFRPLEAPGSARSDLITRNYNDMRRFFRGEYKAGGIDRLEEIYSCLLQRVTVVQIDIRDPLTGPMIFDRLNSGQEAMTIGELVKNDIFSRSIASDPDQLNRDFWDPFLQRFGLPKLGYFDNYFFPFGLYRDPGVRKIDVYSALQSDWSRRSLEPQTIIAELADTQPDYLDCCLGTNSCHLDEAVHDRMRRLWRLGAPTSAYPFLMHISHANRHDELSTQVAVSMLEVLDSFFTRRAVCGFEPTGLHAVFKGLWQELQDKGEVSAQLLATQLAWRKTVQWPDDALFGQQICQRDLYGSRITPYLLCEFNASLGGDYDVNDSFQVEHVLPQHPKDGEWIEFDTNFRDNYTDTLANLLPLSVDMNKEVSNSEYALKRPIYRSDSRFKATRDFASSFAAWTPQELIDRAALMSTWAISRWPHRSPSE